MIYFIEELLLTDKVIYSTDSGENIKSSKTSPKKDVILTIQNDSNLVLYKGDPV